MSDFTFDLGAVDDFTVEQVEWMYEILEGAPDPPPRSLMLRAFAYATLKAENPDATVEDAKKMKVKFGVPPTVPPTRGNGNGSRTTRGSAERSPATRSKRSGA